MAGWRPAMAASSAILPTNRAAALKSSKLKVFSRRLSSPCQAGREQALSTSLVVAMVAPLRLLLDSRIGFLSYGAAGLRVSLN
jgi:hypothetical protein